MTNYSLLTSLTYETRNLGIQSYALSDQAIEDFRNTDLRDEIENLSDKYGEIFIQAKLSPDDFPILDQLQQLGFCYVETTLAPHTIFKKNNQLQKFKNDDEIFIPRRFNRDDIACITLDKNDSSAMEKLRSIAQDSFTKDRFHIDSVCPDSLANGRYLYWLDDMMGNNTKFDAILVKSEMAGFMARDADHLLLAGFSPKYCASGLGDFLWLDSLRKMEQEGLLAAHTQISANNLAVLNLYMRLEFKFKHVYAMFHFWSHKAKQKFAASQVIK